MNLTQLLGEERLFLRRLDDWFGAAGGPCFSPFLSERQLLIAQAYTLQNACEDFLLYGGYSAAQRQVLGVFPSGMTPDTAHFPVKRITATYREKDNLSHRDFLGACLSLRITRESIGDIVISPGTAHIMVLDSVASVLLSELRKVGNMGIRCVVGQDGEVQRNDNFEALRGTVHSPRMDSLVSLLTGLSREKSASLIKGEKVQRNHTLCQSVSAAFAAGDTISIRGYGRFIVDNIGNPTKKGRLPIDCRKYR